MTRNTNRQSYGALYTTGTHKHTDTHTTVWAVQHCSQLFSEMIWHAKEERALPEEELEELIYTEFLRFIWSFSFLPEDHFHEVCQLSAEVVVVCLCPSSGPHWEVCKAATGQKRKLMLRDQINNNNNNGNKKKLFSLKLYCAAAGVAVWHAAKDTLEGEEVMDFGVWHLKKQKTKVV